MSKRTIRTEVFYRGGLVVAHPSPGRELELAPIAYGIGASRSAVRAAVDALDGRDPGRRWRLAAQRDVLVRVVGALLELDPRQAREALDVLELGGDLEDDGARAAARDPVDRGTPLEDEERIVDIRLSSEYPVSRWYGIEILDHEPSSIRTERLESGAPLLAQHYGDPRGVLIDYAIASRVLTVRARFGRGAEAEEMNRDVLDGLWRNASVGYAVHHLRYEEGGDDVPDTFRVDDWEPLEASLVSVGADPTAGPSREPERIYTTTIEERTMTTETEKEAAPRVEIRSAGGTGDDGAAVADDARQFRNAERELEVVERDRRTEIHAIAEQYPNVAAIQAAALSALRGGTPAGEFKGTVAELLRTPAKPLDETPPNEIGMTRKEVERFSIFRWATAVIEAQDDPNQARKKAPFEFECSAAVNDALVRYNPGHEVRGIPVGSGELAHVVPWTLADARRAYSLERLERLGVDERQRELALRLPAEVLADWTGRAHGMPQFRPAMGGTFRAPPMDTTDNAGLVGTDHLAGSFIDALRQMAMIFQAGAIEMPGLVGDVSIPRQTGVATFTWVDEDGDSLDTEVPTDAIPMSPKTLTGSVPITRRLRLQGTPSAEMIVRNDLTIGASETIDNGVINGATFGPTGIINETGVNVIVNATPGELPWLEALEFEAELLRQNAMRQTPSWFLSPATQAYCKGTPKVAGAGATGFVMENGRINGYDVRAGVQISETGSGAVHMLFGDASTVIVGMWGVLDLIMDRATEASKDRLTIRAFQDIDSVVRHGQAWAKGTPTP